MVQKAQGIESFLNTVAQFMNGEIHLRDRWASTKLQRDLLEMVVPLYSAQTDENYRKYLTALVERANRAGLKYSWYLKPVGGKFAVRRSYPGDGSPKQWAYAAIMLALEEGKGWFLRPCLECLKFFVSKDSRKRYCSDDCRNSYHQKNAKFRVEKSREKKRGDIDRARRNASEPREVSTFSRLLSLSRKANLIEPELAWIGPILKRLGQGNPKEGRAIVDQWYQKLRSHGVSETKLFRDLPANVKTIILSCP